MLGSSLLLLAGAALAEPCDADVYPGAEDWAVAEPPNPGAVAALEEYAFTLVGEDSERLGLRTDGVVVVHQGAIVYERYARGYTADQKHLTWSVTKSMQTAVLGAAVGRGLVDLDASICAYTDKVPTENCDITVTAVAQLASGLDFAETYEGEGNQASSVLAMLYGLGSSDAAAFAGAHAKAYDAGTTFVYSSGDSVLLAAALGGALGPVVGEDYPWELLFDPLGIEHTTYERDLAGTYIGSSYWYARPRDMARLGYLYLHDGCWDGERVLPEGWVARSTTLTEAGRNQPEHADEHDAPGWSWWLNVDVPERGQTAPAPSLGDKMFHAVGHWGQFIFVSPDDDLVVVRVGDDRKERLDRETFLTLVKAMVTP